MSTAAYFVPILPNGAEGEPVLVDLNKDGSANISRLPKEMREMFETSGFPDYFHVEDVMPSEGARFIGALLESRNPFFRFLRKEDLPA